MKGPAFLALGWLFLLFDQARNLPLLEVVAACRTRRYTTSGGKREQGHLLRARTQKDAPKNEYVSVRLPDDDVHLRIQHEG